MMPTTVSGEIVTSKRSKQGEAGSSKNLIEKCDGKSAKYYIHVRGRRVQPADSHSLAERISERLTLLQDLVPGCSRITGKAVLLDEIINYVQSHLLLSMKLASINPRMKFNRNVSLSREVKENMLYAIACSEERLPSGYYSFAQNMPNSQTHMDLFKLR
ncbi:hypothetical protein Bca4012_010439 [Brassica carinata]